MSQTPLPITGMALCNALGGSLREVREALQAGRSGLRPPAMPLPFATMVGALRCAVPDLPRTLAAWSTPAHRLAALLVTQLDGELRHLRARWSPARIAIVLGTSTAGAEVTELAYRDYLLGGQLPASYDLFKQHTYGSILHVVRELTGAMGPAWVISTACTSSAKCLASARRLILNDVVDAAIVGGIDTLCGMTLRGFHSLEALSATACRPFCADRDGLNLGEGGALLLLERRGDAMALLEGVGESSDAYHISAPHPQGGGACLAMRRALAQAGCEPRQVDHINAHGTGTPLNDRSEAQAIVSLFGAELPVVSTKGYTGHLLGAAGATEAAFAALSIVDGCIPASHGAQPLDASLGVRIVAQRTDAKLRHVLSNSFAFGGNNVSVLIGAA